MDELMRGIGQVLHQFLETGAKLPIHMVSLGRTGPMAYCRYVDDDTGGLACEMLSEPSGDFALPINLMFVDSIGRATYAVIAQDGRADILH
jgi:hypothetical protein